MKAKWKHQTKYKGKTFVGWYEKVRGQRIFVLVSGGIQKEYSTVADAKKDGFYF
jgi:hypothetical protein